MQREPCAETEVRSGGAKLVEDVMTRNYRWLTAIMVAGALAMPASALAQIRVGGKSSVHTAPHFSGGGHSFTPHSFGRSFSPHVGGRSFTRHFSTHVRTRRFTPHIGTRTVTPHFSGTVHTGTTFNRSVQCARRHNFTQSNTHNRTLQSNAGVQTNTLLTRRRNGIAAITPQTARQGRFGSRFATSAGRHHHRFANIAAHRAWRRGLRAGFVSWYGPVFWPYAYSDIFDYAFWPDGYDDGFWFYAYDDFFDGLFWGEIGPPEEYAYAGPSRIPNARYAGVEELCKQPGTGITAWPFRDIERKVGLNSEQRQLLGDVRKAAADAAATFKASCPAENLFPLTPPGRLLAMTARLQGTLDAVKVVRPALDKFYNSLSDEQKERFNRLGPKRPTNNAETTAALPQDAKNCSEAKPGLTNLPIDRIDAAVRPTGGQQDELKQLQQATDKAVSVLQAACPDEVPLTPPGRLEAMETRLKAMVEAANTIKPALEGFYASLSDEQKARFDRIGGQFAKENG
jgi:LTXXQ motif family protein